MASQPREDMPRIAIEGHEDWERVKSNITESMMTILNEKLKSTTSPEVKEALKAHLLQWRDRAFEAAKYNLRVNGRNMEDNSAPEEDTEPWDEALDRRIWALSEERFMWDKTITERRRKAPLEIQNLMEDLMVRQQLAEFEIPEIENDAMEVDSAPMERQAEIIQTHEEAMSYIDGMNYSITGLLEKAERAKRVADEIGRLSP